MSARDSRHPSPKRRISPAATPKSRCAPTLISASITAIRLHSETLEAPPDPFTGFIDSRPTGSDQFASNGLLALGHPSAAELDRVTFKLDLPIQFTPRKTVQATTERQSMPSDSPIPFGLPKDPKDLTLDMVITAMQEMSGRLKNIGSLLMRRPMESLQIPKKNRGRPSIVGPPLQVEALEQHCIPLFTRQFNPSSVQLNNLCLALGPSFPDVSHELLLSSVRLWFRKKRERCGKRVFAACANILPRKLAEGLSLADIKAEIGSMGDLYACVVRISQLGVFESNAVAVAFINDKVQAYYNRHILGGAPYRSLETMPFSDNGGRTF